MNILITGAGGFIGRNLTENLKNIRDGKRKNTALQIEKVNTYDLDNSLQELDAYCREADFVFHLAGVNRPENDEAFMEGNCDFLKTVLSLLKKHGNACPVMLSSSIQAVLDNPYGNSKHAAEDVLREYGGETGADVLIYRFPNVFGKWCRPSYNSVVATFCHHIANDLPITVNDRSARLTLVYIDDVIDELISALQGMPHTREGFCEVMRTYSVTLGELADCLIGFRDFGSSAYRLHFPENSLEKALFSTYLSYLPEDKAVITPDVHSDDRGSFTELVHTRCGGQFSVNISKPGITKGQHWHNSKWELFIVISGEALIQQRRIGSEQILEFRVSGNRPQAVCMLPGYTHNIINLSDSQDLITLMWANENFDPEHPDTYYEPVE